MTIHGLGKTQFGFCGREPLLQGAGGGDGVEFLETLAGGFLCAEEGLAVSSVDDYCEAVVVLASR